MDIETMGPFPLQLAQRYVAPHRVHYRSLSLTIAAQRSAAVVEMPLKNRRCGYFGGKVLAFDGVFRSTGVVTAEVDTELVNTVLVSQRSPTHVDVGCRG